MKWFWLIILALVLGSGAVVLWPAGSAIPEASSPDQSALQTPNRDAGPPLAQTAQEPMELKSPPITVLPESEPVTEKPAPSAVGAPAEDNRTASAATADPLKQLDELLGLAVESERTESTPVEQALRGQSSPSPAESTPEPTAEAEVIASEKFKEIVKARVRRTDDGWLLFDERFPVRGTGTPEDPFEVSWDLLVSASETYQPRQGKLRLPERITMLDGKHVRITGYVAFPIMAASNDELLSMRNMWDGCCIGVPPTPYDAIEVRLAAAATGRDRFTSFGTIEGKLLVDPYVKGNWLLGLYLMEGATLSKVRESQADPSRHGM